MNTFDLAFLHQPTGIVFGCSRKVMSSFFATEPGFVRIRDRETCDYFMARNPYERAVSLWMDKCQTAPFDPLQVNQEILAEAAGLQYEYSKLRDLRFPAMVRLLPKVWKLNDHFRPQTWGVMGFQAQVLCNIIQIDSPAGQAFVTKQFPTIGFGRKANNTPHRHFAEYYDPESIEIIRDIYRNDFTLLGYEL